MRKAPLMFTLKNTQLTQKLILLKSISKILSLHTPKENAILYQSLQNLHFPDRLQLADSSVD